MRKMIKSSFLEKNWAEFFRQEQEKEYFKHLMQFLEQEYQKAEIFPPKEQIFRAFLVPPDKVRVVILGQDPYHTPGVANGLAFSVNEGQKLPPSLKNIFQEIKNDVYGGVMAKNNSDMLEKGGEEAIKNMVTGSDGTNKGRFATDGDLTRWASQGVLLLNNVLTVRAGLANSHQKQGWEIFTDEMLKYLSDNFFNIVFLLWGNGARAKKELICSNKHLVLEAAHPSPLSARRGFFGCGHFSLANKFLREKGRGEIVW